MMNLITLHGRLTKDVEVTGTETKVAKYTIAVTRNYKNKEGAYDSDFINCVAFGKSAEFIAKHWKKGSEILVQGTLQNNNYEDNNKVKRYTYVVVTTTHEFLGTKAKEESLGVTVTAPENPTFGG